MDAAIRLAVGVDPVAQPPRLQEGQRDHFLGGRPVPRQPEGVVVDRADMFVEQFPERVRVPGPYPGTHAHLHVLRLSGRAARFP